MTYEQAVAEMVEGYLDGYRDKSLREAGDNRSFSYRHGFLNSQDDLYHKRPRDSYQNILRAAEKAIQLDTEPMEMWDAFS